ncbi:MAG: ammonium transporter [Nitrosopumilus sp.]|nr:ammonium transporter [Nitrosopumilus sp.]
MVLDSGDTAWMLVAGSLVLLMIPALGLFESGLLRKKNATSIFMQIFFGLALLSVMWFVFGFSLSFGPSTMGLGGNLDWVFLKGVPSDAPLEQYAPTIPGVLFVKFQLMFAAITPLLLTGTIAERMKFSSFIIFISAWSMLIYYPLVHWVWGGGWLAEFGVVDFAGGIVIHTSVGMAALAAAIVLGKRSNYGPAIMIPHSIPLAVLGSSLLWLGWFGFNAGSAFAASGGVDGLLFGNPDQLWIQAVGIAVAAAMGFGGTWVILQIIKHLIGIRVSPEVEDVGLDISEHAESAYSDEEEFMLEMDEYTEDLKDKDEILRRKK